MYRQQDFENGKPPFKIQRITLHAISKHYSPSAMQLGWDTQPLPPPPPQLTSLTFRH